ncbi:MAG: AMP-binding protein [Firmicutes bacterium]|nr:AMP-binding protein [Bacillota bacterium]
MLNLFKEQVIKHGERIALLEPACGKLDTYKQLDENAHRIAAKLQKQGLKHGEAVIITAERGIGYIEAMLGIIMAGGIYVPLSDHYPKERMDYICNDCRAKIIVNNSFIQDAMTMDPVDEYEDISPDDIVLTVPAT